MREKAAEESPSAVETREVVNPTAAVIQQADVDSECEIYVEEAKEQKASRRAKSGRRRRLLRRFRAQLVCRRVNLRSLLRAGLALRHQHPHKQGPVWLHHADFKRSIPSVYGTSTPSPLVSIAYHSPPPPCQGRSSADSPAALTAMPRDSYNLVMDIAESIGVAMQKWASLKCRESVRRPRTALPLAFLVVTSLTWLCTVSCSPARSDEPNQPAVRQYKYRVVASYPHDRQAFTQGLVYENGVLYEGTGLYGQSALARRDLKTGKTLKITHLARPALRRRDHDLRRQDHPTHLAKQDRFRLPQGHVHPAQGVHVSRRKAGASRTTASG